MEKKIYDNKKDIFYTELSKISILDEYRFQFIKLDVDIFSKNKVEYKLIFYNLKNREISINLFEDSIYVVIFNTSRKESFLLENWLEENDINKSEKFLLEKYKGTFLEQILGFKNVLEEFLKNKKLKEILCENYWWKERVDEKFTFIR